MDKIRVAAVSYLNTKPLLYGIRHHAVMDEIELAEDYPAKIAQWLIDDKVDVGLIPVAAMGKVHNRQVITGYCIGCNGPVASVCLFSEVPVEAVENVILDYQSRTSINLARVLLKEYWKNDVNFIEATGEDYRSRIRGTTAAVVIGDRALEQRHLSTYIYDLGEAWKAHTGLPFVFAAWVSNKELPEDFVQRFNAANEYGLQHLDKVAALNKSPHFDLKDYFTKYISYPLTEEKRKGLDLFLSKLKQYQL